MLVSMWNVGDGAPLPLMQPFYTYWAGGDIRAEELRKAQVEVAADPRFARPRHWAAFQIVGAR
ncbi:MAG TPA: CHAT domain-containing protein [Longimicrobium sp.]|nr:CHAT domain-containing protein [Longimicrobium sp.]